MTSWGKRADMIVHEQEPFNAEAPPYALDGHPVTALDTFYSRNHGPVPTLDAQAWRLTVDGMVGRTLTLSLVDLQRGFPSATVLATLQCAGNRRAGLIAVRDIPGEDPWGPGATSTAAWTGVRLADVLAAADVSPSAAHVAFSAPDVSEKAQPEQAYGGSIPLAKALSPEVLLAWAMDDAALTPVHGAPVRVVVPGYIGARSVKWVTGVSARSEPSSNYFQAVAYRLLPADADPRGAGPGDGLSLGPVSLNAAILRPAEGASVPAGLTRVSGYSYAGPGRAVARVDVSVDGGRGWTQAQVDEPASPWSWQLWHTLLDLSPGPLTVTARAWDTSGAMMPESPEHLWNPKGYLNNSWSRVSFTVV